MICRGGVHGDALSHKQNGGGPDNGLSERDFREANGSLGRVPCRSNCRSIAGMSSRTAATIGLHRQSLQEKLRELGIRRPGREPLEEE